MFLAEGADQPEMVAQDARCHFPGAGIQAFRSFFRALLQRPIGDGAASDNRCRGTRSAMPRHARKRPRLHVGAFSSSPGGE